MDLKAKKSLASDIIGKGDASEERDEEFGTLVSGYMPARYGPAECEHCIHASESGTRCDHPAVKADPKVERDGKLAVVEPEACCRYFRPGGATDESEEN